MTTPSSEKVISGKIQTRDVPNSRALRRFIERQVTNWIALKFRELSKIRASYLVEFRREGAGHTFDCQVEINLGNQKWVGHHYEGGLHQALIQCLNQMIPSPTYA